MQTFATNVVVEQENPSENEWYTLYGVHTPDESANSVKVYQGYADSATANGKVMEVQEVLVIDMTAHNLDHLDADEMNSLFSAWFDDTTIRPAPRDLTEDGEFANIKTEESLELYRNKQTIRGGVMADGSMLVYTKEDAAEITARQAIEGGSGIHENVYSDSSIITEADAQTAADNLLKKYGRVPVHLSFSSDETDWRPGTKLKANLPTFGISSDTYFLIEEVSIVDLGARNLRSLISATKKDDTDFSTQRSENYIDYFSKLAGSTVKTLKHAVDYTDLIPEGIYPGGTFISEKTIYSPTIAGTDGRFSGELKVGTGNDLAGISGVGTDGGDIRFWAGHATAASAPFRVTQAGELTATNVVSMAGTFTELMAGTEGAARLEMGDDSGPFIDFYDSDNDLRIRQISTGQEFWKNSIKGATIEATTRDVYTDLTISATSRVQITPLAVIYETDPAYGWMVSHEPDMSEWIFIREADRVVTERAWLGYVDTNFELYSQERDIKIHAGAYSVRLGSDLIPDTNDSVDLGSSTRKWKDFYLSGDASVTGNLTAGSIGIGESSPEEELHIRKVGGPALLLHDYSANNDGTTYSAINFWGSTDAYAAATPSAQIKFERTTAGAISDIIFSARGVAGGSTFGEAMRIDGSAGGKVGIGTSAPVGKVSIQDGSGFAIWAGADVDADTLTNNTRKFVRIGMPHYTNAEEPFSLIVGDSDGTDNFVKIGGGTSQGNAATEIIFYTVSTGDTTTTGTERARIDKWGKFDMSGSTFRLRSSETPASASAPGNEGDVCFDVNYMYRCVATNTWKRTALNSW